MARPREFDVDEALDRATALFWTRGYEATSVQDLVDALGVNRASLYGTFGDKAQLFAAVLERYGRQVNEVIADALAPPASGAEAIGAWFRALIEMATQPRGPRGCLFIGAVSFVRHRTGAAPGEGHRGRPGLHRPSPAGAERDPQIARRENIRTLARFFAAEGHGLAVLARAGVRRPELEAAARWRAGCSSVATDRRARRGTCTADVTCALWRGRIEMQTSCISIPSAWLGPPATPASSSAAPGRPPGSGGPLRRQRPLGGRHGPREDPASAARRGAAYVPHAAGAEAGP